MNHQLSEYTVSQISNKLKGLVESEFSSVKIKGEVSGFKLAPSGHAYFSLKDNNAVLAAVCWRGVLANLKIKPEEGMELVCIGNITIYPGQSKYQLVVESLEHSGIGTLMALLEKRKAELAKEGLFAIANKKPIPFLPKTIGVVTSPTGAVIRDILHRIEDRFPCNILIWPVLVQGEKSASQVSEAIDGFNSMDLKPEVIIVARGGGSVEDLWPFNEEIVVRSAYASKIPLISAIGHETDYTLLDLVADLRAPTPTAAAEKAVPVLENVKVTLNNQFKRIKYSLSRYFDELRTKLKICERSMPNYQTILINFFQRLDELSIRLNNANIRNLETKSNILVNLSARLKHPRDILNAASQRLAMVYSRITVLIEQKYINDSQKLKLSSSLLNSYSYKNTLNRGFAIITDKNNNPVTSALQMKQNQEVSAVLKDGKIDLLVK